MTLHLGTHDNAANPGGRDDYSQNQVTARQRQPADSALLDFAKNTGGNLVSPPVPTWIRGDGTHHVILITVPSGPRYFNQLPGYKSICTYVTYVLRSNCGDKTNKQTRNVLVSSFVLTVSLLCVVK